MKCHRIEELLELMEPEWQKDQELNLLEFIIKLSKEAGYEGKLEELTDEVLSYHLKMRNSVKDEMNQGLETDQQDYFKTAIITVNCIL